MISKIERAEALVEETILDIIEESAGIMVARGDLGVEIGDPQLPAQQKTLDQISQIKRSYCYYCNTNARINDYQSDSNAC